MSELSRLRSGAAVINVAYNGGRGILNFPTPQGLVRGVGVTGSDTCKLGQRSRRQPINGFLNYEDSRSHIKDSVFSMVYLGERTEGTVKVADGTLIRTTARHTPGATDFYLIKPLDIKLRPLNVRRFAWTQGYGTYEKQTGYESRIAVSIEPGEEARISSIKEMTVVPVAPRNIVLISNPTAPRIDDIREIEDGVEIVAFDLVKRDWVTVSAGTAKTETRYWPRSSICSWTGIATAERGMSRGNIADAAIRSCGITFRMVQDKGWTNLGMSLFHIAMCNELQLELETSPSSIVTTVIIQTFYFPIDTFKGFVTAEESGVSIEDYSGPYGAYALTDVSYINVALALRGLAAYYSTERLNIDPPKRTICAQVIPRGLKLDGTDIRVSFATNYIAPELICAMSYYPNLLNALDVPMHRNGREWDFDQYIFNTRTDNSPRLCCGKLTTVSVNPLSFDHLFKGAYLFVDTKEEYGCIVIDGLTCYELKYNPSSIVPTNAQRYYLRSYDAALTQVMEFGYMNILSRLVTAFVKLGGLRAGLTAGFVFNPHPLRMIRGDAVIQSLDASRISL